MIRLACNSTLVLCRAELASTTVLKPVLVVINVEQQTGDVTMSR